jgi:hypothetical protein
MTKFRVDVIAAVDNIDISRFRDEVGGAVTIQMSCILVEEFSRLNQ